jgi:hypothetical protein
MNLADMRESCKNKGKKILSRSASEGRSLLPRSLLLWLEASLSNCRWELCANKLPADDVEISINMNKFQFQRADQESLQSEDNKRPFAKTTTMMRMKNNFLLELSTINNHFPSSVSPLKAHERWKKNKLSSKQAQ